MTFLDNLKTIYADNKWKADNRKAKEKSTREAKIAKAVAYYLKEIEKCATNGEKTYRECMVDGRYSEGILEEAISRIAIEHNLTATFVFPTVKVYGWAVGTSEEH